MESFTPLSALLGGALIGLAAAALLLLNGRVAGISGIVGNLLRPEKGEVLWRALFVAGLLLGGLAMSAVRPELLAFTLDRSLATMAAAGLLVGFGARLGSGCTSGHGVCGLARLSKRSLAATMTFMATGVLTAVVASRLLPPGWGGAP